MVYVLALLDQRSIHVDCLSTFYIPFLSYNIKGSSVNKIDSKLHCIVLLRLFENKMAITAVRKLFLQSLWECLTKYVDAHQKLAHTLTLIFFDCKCMIEFNLYLF